MFSRVKQVVSADSHYMDHCKDLIEPDRWCDISYNDYGFGQHHSAPVSLTSSNLMKFQYMTGPSNSTPNFSAPPVCVDFKGGSASDTSSVTAPDTTGQTDDLDLMALGRMHLESGVGRYGIYEDTCQSFDENFPESSHDLDIPGHDILEYEGQCRYQLRSTAPPFEPSYQHGSIATYGDSYHQYLSSPTRPPPQSATVPRTAIPPHLLAEGTLCHSHLVQHQQQYDSSRAHPQRSRELPFPMIKSNSDNRVLGNASRAAAPHSFSQRPSSATSRMVSLPRPASAMSGITTTAGSSVEMEEASCVSTRRAYYSPLQAAQTPPPPEPLRVLSLDVNQCFASTAENHTTERNSIYKFIEQCGAQVILMNNTGLGDEEQLRIVRNEVKTTYHTESAMWASFKTDGGRGVAVLILGPLAPRTGWIRSDSRGHFLSASSRVKPGLPVLSFVACDLGANLPPDAQSTVEAYSSHVGALREMMHSEQEKGAYIVAGGSIISSHHSDASAYNFDDLGIQSLQNRMKVRSGSPEGVETTPGDDVFVSLHTKTDDPFGIKISIAEVVERSFEAFSGASSLVAVNVGGWPQEAFIKQKGSNKSPDSQSPNRKSRSRPNSGSKGTPPRYMMHYDGPRSASPHSSLHSQYLDSLAQYRPSPPMGRELPLHMAPPHQQHRMSPVPNYDRAAHPPQRPVLRDAAPMSDGPSTDSISTINVLLSWRMNVMESLNALERILTSTQWGVVRLDRLKRLVDNIIYLVEDMPHRVGTSGFADAASISVLKSFHSAAPEKLLQSGPEIISQILKTWHASTDHTIQRISS